MLIDERQLEVDGTVKIVEKIAPILKDQVLVLVLCQLIVNVVKLHLLGEIPLRYDADTVPAHLLIGDGLLGGVGDFAVPLGLLDGRGQPPLLCAGQLGIRGQADGVAQISLIFFVLSFCGLQIFYLLCLLFLQSRVPPFHGDSSAPRRRKGCLSGTVGPWGQGTVTG